MDLTQQYMISEVTNSTNFITFTLTVFPPHVRKYLMRIAIEMHNCSRK